MSKAAKRLSVGVGILFGLLVLAVVYVAFFFDVNHYKPQIEAAVARSTGMTLKINGPASLKVLPRVRLALADVHLSNRGSELFAADRLEVAPRLWPFVRHREVIVDRVSLEHPRIRLEKSASGRMNYQTARRGENKRASKGGPGEVRALSIRDGELSYVDRSSNSPVDLKGVNLDLSGISWDASAQAKSISFHGDLQAQSLKAGTLAASHLKSRIRYDHGLVRLDPTAADVFGGALRGNAQIDLRGPSPKLRIAQTATHIDLAQVPSKLRERVSGAIDGVVDLAAAGADSKTLIRTANGAVSVRGRNVTLSGVDVDGLAGALKTEGGLDLARLGSSLFSSQVAGIGGGAAGKKTVLRNLVFDWKIDQGIAHARDVALATPKTTVAFKGDIDLRKRAYQNFYMATVDPKGCAKEKVEIVGSLTHPRPSAGSVAEQLARSYPGKAGSEAGTLGSQIAGILGGMAGGGGSAGGGAPGAGGEQKAAPGGCDPFYSGTVIQGG